MIQTEDKLKELVTRLERADWVAVDTEADSLHAYPEKLCLIQISTVEGDELVDPLAGFPLTSLWEILVDHRLILHGADYDLRLLRKTHGFVPREIFDTMVAARLLGCTEFGLIHLVTKYLGVTLEKGSQKADWAKRPLTERMEQYARNDTHYLKPLSDLLQNELDVRGRAEWHREMCAWLIRECAVPVAQDADEIWRIKGSHKLQRAGLAVLRGIWTWREEEARSANKPPYFILSHELLVGLAEAAASAENWETLVPRYLIAERRRKLEAAIREGLSLAPPHQPEIQRRVTARPSIAEKRRFEELRMRRDGEARDLGIDPTLIASRSTLALLAHDWVRYHRELMSWQQRLLSEA